MSTEIFNKNLLMNVLKKFLIILGESPRDGPSTTSMGQSLSALGQTLTATNQGMTVGQTHVPEGEDISTPGLVCSVVKLLTNLVTLTPQTCLADMRSHSILPTLLR